MTGRLARGCALLLVGRALASCSVVVALPEIQREESVGACADGVDNDLDGEPDCADGGCALHCEPTPVMPPDVSCFADGDRGLAFEIEEVSGSHARCVPNLRAVVPCAANERLVPGATACAAPGSACPAGEWPEPGPDLAVYVRAGARDGDGSRAAPWGTLEEALRGVPSGGTVVLSTGEHASPGTLTRPVTLRGTCATHVTIAGALRIEAEGVHLEDLAVRGGVDGVALALQVTGVAVGRGVVVDGAMIVEGEGAMLALEDAWGRTSGGTGLEVRGGALGSLTTTVLQATGDGARVADGELELYATRIAGTSGVGLALEGSGRATGVRALVLEPSAGAAIEIACAGSDAAACADMEDVWVRFGTPSARAREGIVVSAGTVSFVHTTVIDSWNASLRVRGGNVTVRHGWFEAAIAAPGLVVEDGGQLTVLRTYVWDHVVRGIEVEGGGTFIGGDLEVAGAPPGSVNSECILARSGSSLTLERFRLQTCEVCGLDLEAGVSLGLTSGLIVGNTRGACLRPGARYPVGDLTTSVAYRGNATNILETR